MYERYTRYVNNKNAKSFDNKVENGSSANSQKGVRNWS